MPNITIATHRHSKQAFAFVAACFTGIITLLILNNVDHYQSELTRQKYHNDLEQSAHLIRSKLQTEINERLRLVHALSAFVNLNPGFSSDDFNRFSQQLYEQQSYILNVQLAPQAIIRHVFPLEGSQSIMGTNLLSAPDVFGPVRQSIRNHEFMIQGPKQLLQGGTALIGRWPVFIKDSNSKDSAILNGFWGFATVLIDMQGLLASIASEKGSADFSLALRSEQPHQGYGLAFYGDNQLFENNAIITEVSLPKGSWQLAVAPKNGLHTELQQPLWRHFFNICAAVLIAWLTWSQYQLRTLAQELKSETQKAKAADQSKSEFLASMSHEIRTPINGVIGATDLLLDTRLDQQQQELAETVLTSGRSLITIINDILDFSKLEAGRLELDSHDFKPRQLTADILQAFYPLMQEKALRFHLSIEDTVPENLHGAADRIRQVIVNLMNNAVKFTHHGKIHLHIDWISSQQDNGRLRISVTDTGIGIPKDKQDALFQRFSQVDASTSREYGGTGLGLAISKHLVRLMRGDMGMLSDQGKGSCFWFEVECSERHAMQNRNVQNDLPNFSNIIHFRPLKILLAEDNPTNQLIVRTLMRKLSHHLDIASDGQEAVIKAGQQAYDLILMDWMMPQLDGLAATNTIRGREGPNRETPIIALTANAMEGNKDTCLEAGMNDYLTKPFNRADLEEILHKWCTNTTQVKSTLKRVRRI